MGNWHDAYTEPSFCAQILIFVSFYPSYLVNSGSLPMGHKSPCDNVGVSA